MSKREITNNIQELVPPGSGEPRDPQVLEQLTSLTGELIGTYDNGGELNEHPFRAVEARTIHLYDEDVRERLQGRTILVTGGEGFIGSELIKAVRDYSSRKIVSVDIVNQRTNNPTERQFYRNDISDLDSLARIFEAERPEVVFHLAAEREPARAVIPRLTSEELAQADRKRPTSADVLKVLRQVESLGAEVARLAQIVDN